MGQGELDPGSLTKDPEKIKILMRRDPKFITRLISDLDKNMHAMMLEKHKRMQHMVDAQKEIEQINEQIKMHIKPNLDRLEGSIKSKTALRDHLTAQIDSEFGKVRDLEAEARALIQRSRHTAGKLMRSTANQRLEEARGFSSSTPTTAILRGTKGAQAGGNTPTRRPPGAG